MPRMSKKMKEEWTLFLGDGGRRMYNIVCRRCRQECKQSYRTTVVACSNYQSKRARM